MDGDGAGRAHFLFLRFLALASVPLELWTTPVFVAL